MSKELAVWFPTVRTGTGAAVFTGRLVEDLKKRGIRAEITWLPHRAEFLPWSVSIPPVPQWANVVHINSWLHARFIPPGLPVVVTVHTCVHDKELLPYKSILQRLYHQCWVKRLEKAAFLRAAQVVCVSQYVKRKTEEWQKVSSPFKIIYNGVELRSDFVGRNPHSPFRLLYAGNWKRLKGVDLLGPIMRALGNEFELWYTADIGGSDKKFDLPPNCKNIGRLDPQGMMDIYREVDALLFPSRLEGFGLVAAEAMSNRLPVIATRCSSLVEVIDDGITGLLCQRDSVASFKDAAEKLAQDERLWIAMSTAAQERVRNFFSLDQMVDEYINVYRACIGDRNIGG